MVKILFICHGNICRSPMAEFVLRDMAAKAGVGEKFKAESAAVSREEIGNPVYPPVKRLLSAHGIDCRGKTARQMTKADYDEFDLLVCMDDSNMARMKKICGGDPEGKMYMMLEFANRSGGVADPWYTGDFEATWRDVTEGCAGIIEKFS